MKNKRAFSLVELLLLLIVVSIVVAAFAPVITKKLKSNALSINTGGSVSEITTQCADNPNFGPKCKLCTKSYCINCGLDGCAANEYKDIKRCECKLCSEKYSNLCASCDSDGCLMCKSASYYINNGVCTLCPAGSYCDGKNIYATCPGDGYYCDDTGIHRCSEKFSSFCATCTASGCTSCNPWLFLEDNTCKSCGYPCVKCLSPSYCTQCDSSWILDTSTNMCTKRCDSVMEGCTNCASATECTFCNGKYFLNTLKKCTKCTLANCMRCMQNRPAELPACEFCESGYYLNSSGTCSACSSKFGAKCISCNTNKCLSCQKGYHLKDASSSSACESDDNKFNCSDSNFMQVDNLCMTRRNMGDSSLLTIPRSVNIVSAGGGEICYADSEKCCWKGATANQDVCDSENGGYSGCTRTLCDWDAAKEICDNFNYAGKTWRLPTKEELTNLPYLYSIKLGANGLMLCDYTFGFSSASCGDGNGRCLGAYGNHCFPYGIWSGSLWKTLHSYEYELNSGSWNGPFTYIRSHAFSVRCVTEMDSGE